MRSSWWISSLAPLLLVAGCGGGDDSNGAGAASAGGAGGVGGANAGGSGGTSGGSTGSGGTTGGSAGSGGSGGAMVQDPSSVRTGPPCRPGAGISLADATLEALFAQENLSLQTNILVTSAGVFWGQADTIQRLPHAGGTPEVATSGEYWQIFAAGTDLLMLERGNLVAQTEPRAIFRASSTGDDDAPEEVGSTIDGDRVMFVDGTHAYVENGAAETLARIALADGAREELATGVYMDAPTLAGDFVYFIGANEDIYRLPKSGGTPEQIAYVPHIPWSLQASGDTLLVGAWEGVYSVPIAGGEDSQLAGFSDVGFNGAGYVEDMTPDGDRFFLQTSDAYVAWVANDGSTCQGIIAPSLSFGYRAIFEDYLYVAGTSLGTLEISRLALPQ